MTAQHRIAVFVGVIAGIGGEATLDAADERRMAYVELEGMATEFRFVRQWRSYYWRDDFTFRLRIDDGRTLRIISREPTPWNNLRLGTTYPESKIDWDANPRVKLVGVAGVDRTPAEFHDVELDPATTVTAFIVRTKSPGDDEWRDHYVNNWFHRWGPETDVKMLAHYANDDPNYTIYGFLAGIAAPFDAASQKLLDERGPDYTGIIHHSRVVKAKNDVGYELELIHLLGRNKRTLRYEAFHGDPDALIPLDQRKPDR